MRAYMNVVVSVFPAHAGMSPPVVQLQDENIRFPRTRGDEPFRIMLLISFSSFSPHTRG